MILTTRLALPILTLALALPLAACGGSDTGSDSSSAPPAASSAPASTSLDLATVQRVTGPRFQTDPNCGFGQWSENSTGIDEEFRGSATTIQQFDCYLSQDDVGGLPERGQQSIFVEFADAASATSFAESESSLYSSIVDDTRVVVAGLGLESVDMKAYLEELKSACGCGTVTVAGS